MKPANPRLRVLYVIWAVLETWGFAGIIFGWGSLVFILKDEGLFLDLCDKKNSSALNITLDFGSANLTETQSNPPDNTQANCDDRDAMFSLVFSIGSSIFDVGNAFMGQINFMFGNRKSRLLGFVLFIIGALLVAFTSIDMPWLIFPGLSFLGIGGVINLVTNFQFALLFPSYSFVVIGIITGAMDSSSVVQQIIKLGYEGGITRRTSYLILAAAHGLTLINTFLFLPKDFIDKKTADISDVMSTKEKTAGENSGEQHSLKNINNDSSSDNFAKSSKPNQSLKTYMLSPLYIMHVFWFCLLKLRFYYFVNTLNTTLERRLQSQEDISYFTDVFGYSLLGGIPAALLAGFIYNTSVRCFAGSKSILHRILMPTVIPQTVTTLLAVLLSALMLLEDPSTLYVTFATLAVFRSFMFTMAAGYISALYPPRFFGPLFGLMFLISAGLSFFQYAFTKWTLSSGSLPVDVFLSVMCLLTLAHPIAQWVTATRAKKVVYLN